MANLVPCTTSRPCAVLLTRVPGLLAAHTYTPECWTVTSEMIRFPVPSTWMPSTPMGRPSEEQDRGAGVRELGVGEEGSKSRNIPEFQRTALFTSFPAGGTAEAAEPLTLAPADLGDPPSIPHSVTGIRSAVPSLI